MVKIEEKREKIKGSRKLEKQNPKIFRIKFFLLKAKYSKKVQQRDGFDIQGLDSIYSNANQGISNPLVIDIV